YLLPFKQLETFPFSPSIDDFHHLNLNNGRTLTPQIVVKLPQTFFNTIAKEKYKNNISKREASMLFDEDSINAQFGLSTVQDEHFHFAVTITSDGLIQVLKDLCVEGTQWTISW
ncbi:hypothetical protein J1N35_001114, partial [Gossypium stocksii]